MQQDNQNNNQLSLQLTQTQVAQPAEKQPKLQHVLNREPAKEHIKINKFANNSNYLPISYIEQQLDLLFSHCWNIVDFKWQIVANEIVGSIELHCQHPENPNWIIKRVGSGAVMIQYEAQFEEDAMTGMPIKDKYGKPIKKKVDITDISKKIPNTLVKDFPHLKAACLRNAAQSLGKIFGRDLNRDAEETYTKDIQQIKAELGKCATVTELSMLFHKQPSFLQELLKPTFLERQKKLQNA